MSGPEFTLPPQILDMLAKGLQEMDDRPASFICSAYGAVREVRIRTDSGDVLTFLRGQDMGRT